MKAIALGISASFFFAFTFVLNRAMNLAGGSWVWSGVLRYLFMIPPLLFIVIIRGNLRKLLADMLSRPWVWLLWSTIGFGFFYAPLCFASVYGPAWLVASTWQITIVAGSLLAPLFYEIVKTDEGFIKVRAGIPLKGLLFSFLILTGVIIIQFQQAQALTMKGVLYGVIPVIFAAFAYPLGNRKMMVACDGLDTYQRVLGMTLGSIPFWSILAVYGGISAGIPSLNQTIQSMVVALSSGVIATVLFFSATEMTRGNMHKLAAVEATQSGEIVFALLGELFILHGDFPTIWAFVGMLFVILGMSLHSLFGRQ